MKPSHDHIYYAGEYHYIECLFPFEDQANCNCPEGLDPFSVKEEEEECIDHDPRIACVKCVDHEPRVKCVKSPLEKPKEIEKLPLIEKTGTDTSVFSPIITYKDSPSLFQVHKKQDQLIDAVNYLLERDK